MQRSKLVPISIIAIVVGGFLIWAAVRNTGDEEITNGEIDVTNWDTYTNEEYGFSIKHPASWRVAEFPDNPIQPAFNIYKPGTESGNPPFIHHSDVVHVSIFPLGVPTEGIFGENVPSNVNFKENTQHALDYILEDDGRWATMAVFELPPQTWQGGFIFSAASIEDMVMRCLRNGEEISLEECDQFTGDTIVREGNVNMEERAIEVAMLESFEFTRGTAPTDDLIHIEEPDLNDEIESGLVVSGEARGNWYFEASFPVEVVDSLRNRLGIGFATAEGEWMTTEFVPFEGTISFTIPTTSPSTGFVIFHKDNPSGLPEHDASVEVPVRFMK